MGLDWLLENKPKNAECICIRRTIKTRMKELMELGLDNPEDRREYEGLQRELPEFEMTPEESVGMKRLGEAESDEQKYAFEKYAMPCIINAKEGVGSEIFISRWVDMTFEKWINDNRYDFLIESVPEHLRKSACIGGSHQGSFGPLSFRGNVLKRSRILPEELISEAWRDMDTDMMLSHASRLESVKIKWETQNQKLMKSINMYREDIENFEVDYHWTIVDSMSDIEYEEYDKKMKSKYRKEFIGFIDSLCESTFGDYRALEDAIKWLQFWAKKGHSMYASW